MRSAFIALAAIVTIITGAAAQAAESVKINSGALAGASADGVRTFKNIRYAAPPIGALRWRAPQAPAKWTGVRDATSYGAACPQPSRGDGLGAGVAAKQDEDCLTLNVWAPENARKLPVMVWIHGGAYRLGSGTFPTYDGTALAKQGVVLVTINYRLGLLGYFAHPALTAEAKPDDDFGNYGFLDQLAALIWVKENIAAFGGDAGNVTVFGESAGGSAVIFLLASPRAKGLFQKAIVESGGGFQRPQSLKEEEQAGAAAAKRISLSDGASADELRAKSAQSWIEAAGPLQGLGFGPFIDGRVITEAPLRAFKDGRAANVPLIIGANSNEASVIQTLGVNSNAVALFAGDQLAQMRSAYGGAAITDGEFARQALGDVTFVAPARWIAAQHASAAPTFLYHFSYVAAARRGIAPGAGHGSEIPYVFQTWDRMAPIIASMVSDEDRAYSRMMSACWTSFAKTGSPSCPGARAWPAYSPATDSVMEFAPHPQAVTGFRKAPLDFVTQRVAAQLR